MALICHAPECNCGTYCRIGKVPNPKFKPARKVAGKTLQEWQEFARRDDCLEQMVPSDLRQLIQAIS